jgi:cell pole-organizing protein PopZ
MSTPAKASEPTMEEILASIRRIISDDQPGSDASSGGERPAAEDPAVDALREDELDAALATLAAGGTAAEPAPSPATASLKPHAAPRQPVVSTMSPPDDLDVLDLTEAMAEDQSELEAKRDETVSPPRQSAESALRPEPAPSTERLLSNEADDAVTQAFGTLANTIFTNNARTLDDVVKDMLRPMLRAWLDDNLPPLVERLVRQEIERVARGGR